MERVFLGGAKALLGRAGAHQRQPCPSALVFHATLRFFPSRHRRAAAPFSFSVGWRRERFEEALGEDQKAGLCKRWV